MKHLYQALLIIFLFPLFSWAQSNYKAASVVNLKGDTIHGFIDYKEWENNPTSIDFKHSLNTPVQKYTTADIRYFQINHFEAYQQYSGPVSTDETNLNRLSTGRDTSSRIDNLFLKVEQKGMYLTLFSYTDGLKTRYFIAEKGAAKPIELIYHLYLSTDGYNKSVEENKYKGQLIYLSSKFNNDNDGIRELINNASYNQDLIAVVEKINHYKKQASSHTKSAVSFYVGISSGLTSVKPPADPGAFDHTPFDRKTSTVNSYLPKISLGINAYVNPDIGKLIFRTEVSVSQNNMKTYFRQYFYSDNKSELTLNQLTISFSPQILYNIYNSTPFKFYVEGGVNINYSKYNTNEVYDANGSEYPLAVQTYWFSIPLTAGIVLNSRIGIFVTYIIPTVISTENYRFYSDQIGLNYIFGRK
jgi:hypothetical protein